RRTIYAVRKRGNIYGRHCVAFSNTEAAFKSLRDEVPFCGGGSLSGVGGCVCGRAGCETASVLPLGHILSILE
ncbi:hypothetical protein CK820_G0056188, partial [Pan troglodytes]